jgi:hypothetical protein
MPLEPIHIATLRMRLDLTQEFDDFRTEARLAGIGIGNDRLDLQSHDESIRANQPRTQNSVARNVQSLLVKKVYGNQLRHV